MFHVQYVLKRWMITLWPTVTPSGQLSDLCFNCVRLLCGSCLCQPGLNSDPQLACESPRVPQPTALSTCVPAGTDSGCAQDAVRYFSVMWCKASKKKHKRWEGDAVLVIRGRTATLKDMEGKDIGKGEGPVAAVNRLFMPST